MMDLLDLALQPSVLSMGTDRARPLFIRDLDRVRTMQTTSRATHEKGERAAFDERVRRGEKSRFGTPLRFQASNPTQYMLDAVMREAAIQQYDSKMHALKSYVEADGQNAPAWVRQAVLP